MKLTAVIIVLALTAITTALVDISNAGPVHSVQLAQATVRVTL